MPIRFLCRKCHVRMKVPDGSVSKRVKCPKCYFAQTVPASGHLVKGDDGQFVVGTAYAHASGHPEAADNPGGNPGAGSNPGGNSGVGSNPAGNPGAGSLSSQVTLNTGLDSEAGLAFQDVSQDDSPDASAGSMMAHVFANDGEIVDTTEMATDRHAVRGQVHHAKHPSAKKDVNRKDAKQPVVRIKTGSMMPKPGPTQTKDTLPSKKEACRPSSPSASQRQTTLPPTAKTRQQTPLDEEDAQPHNAVRPSVPASSSNGSSHLAPASGLDASNPMPASAQPTLPAGPTPQPIDTPPPSGQKLAGKPLPLSSQTDFFVSQDRNRSLDLAGELEQRKHEATGLAGHHYPALLTLTWIFRLLAFFAVGSVIRQVIESVDASEGLYPAGQKVFLLVGLVALIWLLGEMASAVRDIAIGSRRM